MKVPAMECGKNQLMDVEHENGKFAQEKCFMWLGGFHFNSRHLVTLRLMDFFSPFFHLIFFCSIHARESPTIALQA
jgi:hypothetical protein